MYNDFDYYYYDVRQQPQFFPGGFGNIQRQINRLENQVNRLNREINRLDRRLDRVERRIGLGAFQG